MLVLYTQPRCHYCEIMKRMLSKMDEAEGFQTVDITKDPEARSFLKKKWQSSPLSSLNGL